MPFRRHSDAAAAKPMNAEPSTRGGKAARASARAARLARATQDAARTFCEKLEGRTLLTALVNGVFQGTGTAFDGGTFFDYTQPTNTHIRISVFGNITAEFIGARYDPTTPSNVSLTDLIPFDPSVQSDVWLFSIYVVKADMNSTISIAEMVGPPATIHMDSTTTGETIRFANSVTGVSTTGTASVGGAYLGAKTPASFPGTTNNIPLIYADQRRFGLRPASAGELFAGLEVAPGNDLGRFMFGGAVTGLVDVPGNMQTFYAGGILTGDAQGIYALNSSNDGPVVTAPLFTGFPPQGNSGHFANRNFHIGGDVRNIICAQSYGTISLINPPGTPPRLEDTIYKTGMQMDIGGRVGQIRGLDSFMGVLEVHNDSRLTGPGIAQKETEFRGANIVGFSYFDPAFVGNDVVPGNTQPVGGDGNAFFNDTFDTAQWLGTTFSRSMKSDEVIQLDGSLGSTFGQGGDNVDFYAVPLLAGQVMQVQLAGSPGLTSGMAIEDPDGRIIATNYTSVISGFRHNAPIRIVADRPGAYRIVVARFGDINFNGTTEPGEAFSAITPDQYQLRIRKVGDIALGGLIMNNDIATTDYQTKGIQIDRGDLGEIRAGLVGGRLVGTIFSWSSPWTVSTGNFRAMEASDFGIYTGQPVPVFQIVSVTDVSGPDFIVRKGSVGLLRQTDGAGALVVNDDQSIFPTEADDLGTTSKSLAVGNQIQVVEAAGDLSGDLLANGSIGVLRAATFNNVGIAQTVIMADVDQSGSDGKIDLIECPGVFNGPAIWTGPNGDVRYLHLTGPVGSIFRDPRFGAGTPENITGAPGQKLTVVDDSGTTVTLTPTPLQPNPFVGIGQPQLLDAPSLTLLTYPVRSGGKLIVDVTVTPAAPTVNATTVGGAGITVTTSSRGSIGSVGIGQLNILGQAAGSGIPITFDPVTRTYAPTPPPVGATQTQRPVDVLLKGPATIDVWNINSTGVTFRNIENDTDGEIVNMTSPTSDVQNLEANNVGIARSSTGTLVQGINITTNVFPFIGQRNLIQVNNLAAVSARQGLGNILAGNIGEIEANSDGKNVKGVFEGIDAPIYSQGVNVTNTLGNIVSVRIGEGVLPSGTGDVVFSGIFADNVIDSISGTNADIRGTIAAAGGSVPNIVTDPVTLAVTSTPTQVIGSIRLKNGSIINAHISEVQNLANTREYFGSGAFTSADYNAFVNGVIQPNEQELNYDIGEIRIDGNGGIIGSIIQGADVGPVEINGGFGFIASDIVNTSENTMAGVTTDGYGLRGALIDGGGTVVQINARGNGKRVPTTSYNANVRLSEKYSFDPYSTNEVDALNDLHAALGTTSKKPTLKGINETGIVQDSVIRAKTDLQRLDALRIIARNITAPDPRTGVIRVIPFNDAAYPMQLNFGDHVGKINVRDLVNGLSMTTGAIDSFSAKNDVQNAFMTIRGRAKNLSAGAFRGTTTIETVGGEGQIDNLSTTRSLYATVNSSQDIITTKVGTDLGSPKFYSSGTIHHLTINGSILTGAHVRGARRIANLTVGHDIKAGATVSTRRLDNQTVKGQVLGDIIITPTP